MPSELTPSPVASRNSRKGGVIVPKKATFKQRLAAWVIFLALRGIALTLRRRLDDRSGFFNPQPAGPAIYVVWHNRLALCLEAYWRYAGRYKVTPGMAAMVSASKDGGFLSGILESYKVQPVRGSSSRRGPQAMLELTGWAERGYDLAITPDGPRGPRYALQEGAMSLAQLTGLPLLPVSYSVDWCIRLKTWDRFLVPLPFARWSIVVAPPVRVPRDTTDAERENLRKQFEATMREITRD